MSETSMDMRRNPVKHSYIYNEIICMFCKFILYLINNICKINVAR